MSNDKLFHTFSRPGDSFDSVRAECIIRNYPADNNTLQLAEIAVAGIALRLSIVIENSSVISGEWQYSYSV